MQLILLQLLLNSLPEDCYFNIIGFGSKFNLLFPKASRKNCEEALSLAKAFAEGNSYLQIYLNLPNSFSNFLRNENRFAWKRVFT